MPQIATATLSNRTSPKPVASFFPTLTFSKQTNNFLMIINAPLFCLYMQVLPKAFALSAGKEN